MFLALILAAATDLSAVSQAGKWLFHYDDTTSLATRALIDAKVPLDGPGLYLARINDDSSATVYWGSLSSDGDTFKVRYAEHRDAGGKFALTKNTGDAELLPMARAVSKTLDSIVAPTDLDYAYAARVLDDKSIDVIAYPASQPVSAIYVWGADYVFHFSADGNSLLSHRTLHHSYYIQGDSKFQHNGNPQYVRSGEDEPELTDVYFAMLTGRPTYIEYASGVYRIEPSGDVHPDKMPPLREDQAITIER